MAVSSFEYFAANLKAGMYGKSMNYICFFLRQLQIPDPNKTTEYKKGYVMRKCCTDPDGRKSPCARSVWFFVISDVIRVKFLNCDNFVNRFISAECDSCCFFDVVTEKLGLRRQVTASF